MCILHLLYLPLPPVKEHSGSSAPSYPGAEDIMDSPYCQPCFSLHAAQLMPILPHLHLHFWQQSLHSVSTAQCERCTCALPLQLLWQQHRVVPATRQRAWRGLGLLGGCTHVSHTPGSHWRQWDEGELRFPSGFRWSGEIVHVVFCRTLPPFKGSQPDLPRQRLDVRPNALDRSLSAVKASPPPVLKQSSRVTLLLPSLGSEQQKCCTSWSCSGQGFCYCYSKLTFPFKRCDSGAFK